MHDDSCINDLLLLAQFSQEMINFLQMNCLMICWMIIARGRFVNSSDQQFSSSLTKTLPYLPEIIFSGNKNDI